MNVWMKYVWNCNTSFCWYGKKNNPQKFDKSKVCIVTDTTGDNRCERKNVDRLEQAIIQGGEKEKEAETDDSYAEMATAFQDSEETGPPVWEKMAEILNSRVGGKLPGKKNSGKKWQHTRYQPLTPKWVFPDRTERFQRHWSLTQERRMCERATHNAPCPRPRSLQAYALTSYWRSGTTRTLHDKRQWEKAWALASAVSLTV